MHPHEQYLVSRGLARWYRGRLIPVMKGGDPRALFPEPPDDFAALTEEDLNAWLAAAFEAKDKVVAKDPEFLDGLTQAEVIQIFTAAAPSILAAKAELEARALQAETFDSELASLNAQVDPAATLTADPDPDDGGTDDDAAAEPAAEPATDPVVAAAEVAPEPTVAFRRPLPAAGRHQAVVQNAQSGMTLRASAGLQSVSEGRELNEEALNNALVEKMMRASSTAQGVSEKIVVASADIRDMVPDHRRLRLGDPTNQKKIEALTAAARIHGVGYGDTANFAEAEALTASGGICAPVTPYYNLAFISDMARPVRDALVGYVADRGGIQFAPPPYLAQITTGVGVITAAQDLAGGTAGTKTCQTLICPPFQIVDVNSIFHCFQGGNLGQRAFPEQASQFSSLILTQHARVAETQLLNQIKAGSTNVEGQSSVLGAISSLLNDMLTAAAAYRSNNRMPQDAPLQAIMPAWAVDVLTIDLLQSQFDRFKYNRVGIEALLNSFNVHVTWTLDGPTDGDGQILPRQAGSLGSAAPGLMTGTFPTVCEWSLFHPGAWLFVDSGVLELGIVRDSVLNATNSYQVFGESWEAAAGIGVQSLWIYSNICASGAVTLPVSNIHQCGT